MADFALKYQKLGANIIGSCCGSTPEYTKEFVQRLKQSKPLKSEQKEGVHICSRTAVVTIDKTKPVKIIGERINPSGRKKVEA